FRRLCSTSANTGLLGPAISRPSAFRGSLSFVSTIKANSHGLDVESTHSRTPRSRNTILTPSLRSVYPKRLFACFRPLHFTRSQLRILLRFGLLSPKGQECQPSIRLH